MLKELIALYSHVTFDGTGSRQNLGDDRDQRVTAFNKEIATLGYTFDKDVLIRLSLSDPDTFNKAHSAIVSVLRDLSGATNRNANVLFNKFPYSTPDQASYLMDRLFGYMQSHFGLKPEGCAVLSCGHVIDRRIFNIEDFGACPVCQFQVPELTSHEEVRHQFQRMTPLKVLSYATEFVLQDFGNRLLSRGSSLSDQEKTLLTGLVKDGVRLTPPLTIYKENLPFVYTVDPSLVMPHLSGATDVLRIAYFVSDPKSDLSLKDNVRFKITKRNRNWLLALLEHLGSSQGPMRLAEDLLRYRERWLRLAEKLHPNTDVAERRYPTTALAFLSLRNDPKRIMSFNRTVEAHVRAVTVDSVLLDTLASRPGEFLRRLDFLLRSANSIEEVFMRLRTVVRKAPMRLLMAVGKYLEHRKVPTEKRFFVPKGRMNKIQIVDDRRMTISDNILTEAVAIIMGEVFRRLETKATMGKVYIDDDLRQVILPFNKRGDSESSVAVLKGSRYPVSKDCKVVRLFIYWKGRDVDLSMMGFNENFHQIEHIAYTNTQGSGATHSGDIQRAPDGASEFIDFEIETLRKRGIRYVVTSVISFTGEPFDSFECYAGFMERDKLKSGARYEPESVKLKFNLTGKTRSYVPLIFDLDERKVIFADISAGGSRYSAIIQQEDKMAALGKMILDLPNRMLTVYDLLRTNAQARGQIVGSPEDADIKFLANDPELDVEKIVDLYLDAGLTE